MFAGPVTKPPDFCGSICGLLGATSFLRAERSWGGHAAAHATYMLILNYPYPSVWTKHARPKSITNNFPFSFPILKFYDFWSKIQSNRFPMTAPKISRSLLRIYRSPLPRSDISFPIIWFLSHARAGGFLGSCWACSYMLVLVFSFLGNGALYWLSLIHYSSIRSPLSSSYLWQFSLKDY